MKQHSSISSRLIESTNLKIISIHKAGWQRLMSVAYTAYATAAVGGAVGAIADNAVDYVVDYIADNYANDAQDDYNNNQDDYNDYQDDYNDYQDDYGDDGGTDYASGDPIDLYVSNDNGVYPDIDSMLAQNWEKR